MMKQSSQFVAAHSSLLLSAILLVSGFNAVATEKPFAWQQDYARVTETGDIQWTPKEFRFVGGVRAELTSQARLTDGQWHHLIAEADRAARALTLYVDGRRDSHGPGIGEISLANEGDLYVGAGPTTGT